MNAGKAVAKMFRDYGVRYMFGVPGGQHFPIYAGIYDLRPEIEHLCFHDEKNAAFAAYAYALVSRRPGVCDGTVGPGATNLVSGVAEAWAASIPLIAVSGDVPTLHVGKWAAQEIDMRSVLRPFTKAVFRIERVEKIPEMIRMAFRIATTGRPGPVHLIFPSDVLNSEFAIEDQFYAEPQYGIFPSQRPGPDPEVIEEMAGILLKAKKPVIFAGGGALTSGASHELIELAELLCAPVATSMMGKGSISENHPLSIGAAVTFSQPECVYQLRGPSLMSESDLVIFIGTRTDEAATAGWRMPRPGTPCVHIDIDPRELGRNYPVLVGVVADARLCLQVLLDLLRRRISTRQFMDKPRYFEIQKAKEDWRAAILSKLNSSEVPITGHRVVSEIQKIMDPNGILVTDASLVPYYASAFYEAKSAGRVFVSPRGIGSLGSSLPMMIGAKLAAPDRTVIGFGGDGGFSMALSELETMVRAEVKGVYVLLNNSCLGYVAMTLKPSISNQFETINYTEVAKAFGCLGIRVEKPEDLPEALHTALRSESPSLIEVISAVELPTSDGGIILN